MHTHTQNLKWVQTSFVPRLQLQLEPISCGNCVTNHLLILTVQPIISQIKCGQYPAAADIGSNSFSAINTEIAGSEANALHLVLLLEDAHQAERLLLVDLVEADIETSQARHRFDSIEHPNWQWSPQTRRIDGDRLVEEGPIAHPPA